MTAADAIVAAMDRISDGFAVLDAQWRFQYINAAGAAMVSPAVDDARALMGKNHWEMFPDLRGTLLEASYRRAVAEQVTVDFDLFYPPLRKWFQMRAYPLQDGLAVSFVDITQRRQVQESIGVERNILGRLAAGAPLRELLDLICAQTEARSPDGMLCSVMMLDDSGTALVLAGSASLGPRYTSALGTVPVGPCEGSCGAAAYSKAPVTAADITRDPNWERYRALAVAEGLHACQSHPIVSSKGQLLGTVAAYYRQPHEPDSLDASLIAEATNLAAIAIERRHADAHLQSAAERLRATFDQAAVGMAIGDLEGSLLEVNDKFIALLGYPPEELLALGLADITHPDDVAQTRECLDKLLRDEIPEYRLEKRYIRKDGSTVWSRTTVAALRDAGGRPHQLIAAAEDITERKQAEASLVQRETELRALADAMPQLVWMAEPDGNIFWYNRGWYEYTGTTPEQMRDAIAWKRAHHPDVLPRVVELWQRSLATGEAFEMEFPLRGADGSFRMFLTRARPVRDDHGRLVRWFGTNTDVESVERTRQALQEETRVLDIVNTTGQALVAQLDLDALLQQVTDAATQLSGAKFGAFFYNGTDERGEVLQLFTLSGAPREAFARFGHPRATPLFGPTFRGEPPVRIADVLTDPRYGQVAPHHGMPPGHPAVRSYLSVPVISRGGDVIGGLFFGHPDVGVFTERTERVITGIAAQAAVAIDNARLYEALKHNAAERDRLLTAETAARADAEAASRMKDQFLSTLSHELRTPLSAILGWAQVLESGHASADKVPRAIDAIGRNARAQAKLIDDLLDMSRIVSGKVHLETHPVDLNAIIESAAEAVRPDAQDKGVMLRLSAADTGAIVDGDAGRLQQVVWNLLANAIKFTAPGGRIDVTLSRLATQMEIAVSDTGAGINPEFLPFIFERFRQADSSTARTHGGLGIGLALVRELTELHGGSVEARSEGEGRGATFVVRLPLPASAQRTQAPSASVQGAPTPPAVTLKGIKVLVVDDERDIRLVLAELFSHFDATVVTAESAAEGLRCLRDSPPDVLVSDIGMPVTDGYEFIRQVRQLDSIEGGRTPALALTAFAQSADRVTALDAGYQAHIAKPFDVPELLATIARLASSGVSA